MPLPLCEFVLEPGQFDFKFLVPAKCRRREAYMEHDQHQRFLHREDCLTDEMVESIIPAIMLGEWGCP